MGLDLYCSDIDHLVDGQCAYPGGRFSGSGIVTCAGGRTYFTCGWVLVNLLRRLGCRLPIEVWYRGRQEMNDTMRALLESVEGVRCVNATERGSGHRLNGWEIKPYAIIHSRFEEVLFLDCDNVPVRDPSGVFEEEEYRRHGALFWPDRWMGRGDPDRFRTLSSQAWKACGVAERDEPEFESGQMLVNKRRCWRALKLTMFLNWHSDFFYRWLLGDKDTFHIAWRRVGQAYGMPMVRPWQDSEDGPVLYQHDFRGRRLFQHRNQDKWDIDGGNRHVPGFRHEEACLDLVRELRRRWDGVVRRYPEDYSRLERETVERVFSERLFSYRTSAPGLRLVEMKSSFEIGLGKGRWETAWDVEQNRRGVKLTFHNGKRKMCILDQCGDVTWHGRCLHFDRTPITVEPTTRLLGHQRHLAESVRSLLGQSLPADNAEADRIAAIGSFVYRRAGRCGRLVELATDHTVTRGANRHARWWFVDCTQSPCRLTIWGELGQSSSLVRQEDGVWRGSLSLGRETPVELVPASGAFESGGAAFYYEMAVPDLPAGSRAASYYETVVPDLPAGSRTASYYETVVPDLLAGSRAASYYETAVAGEEPAGVPTVGSGLGTGGADPVPLSAEKLILAIMTVNRKPQYVHRTLASLFASGPLVHELASVHLVIDTSAAGYLDAYRHHRKLLFHPLLADECARTADWGPHRRFCRNYVRCLALPVPKGGGICVCEDDIIFRDRFVERLLLTINELEAQVDRTDYCLALFSDCDFEMEPSLYCGRYVCRHGLPFHGTQCMYYPGTVVTELGEFLQRYGVDSTKDCGDLLIHRLCQDRMYASPRSLVDHIGEISTGLGGCRPSPTFHLPFAAISRDQWGTSS